MAARARGTDDRLRRLIRSRLADGYLPRERSRSMEWRTVISSGPAASDCVVCTESIPFQQAYILIQQPGCSPLRLHERCEQLWDSERRYWLSPPGP